MYVLNGELVDKDAPGNIMYGYMGKAYNIPEYILYLAASYAQISAGTTNPQFLVLINKDVYDNFCEMG